MPSPSYTPPTATVKLLGALPCPLYKNKTFHIIFCIIFHPWGCCSRLLPWCCALSGIVALYPRTGIKVHFAARPECFCLPCTPWALQRLILSPSLLSSSFFSSSHAGCTCSACGRGWLGRRVSVLGSLTAGHPCGSLVYKSSLNKGVWVVFAQQSQSLCSVPPAGGCVSNLRLR